MKNNKKIISNDEIEILLELIKFFNQNKFKSFDVFSISKNKLIMGTIIAKLAISKADAKVIKINKR